MSRTSPVSQSVDVRARRRPCRAGHRHRGSTETDRRAVSGASSSAAAAGGSARSAVSPACGDDGVAVRSAADGVDTGRGGARTASRRCRRASHRGPDARARRRWRAGPARAAVARLALLEASPSSGAAMKIDEYEPVIRPTSRASANSRSATAPMMPEPTISSDSTGSTAASWCSASASAPGSSTR